MSFVVLILFAAVLFLLVQFGLQESNKNRLEKIDVPSTLKRYRFLLTNRHFMAYSLAISFAWCAYYTYIQTSSLVFQTILGMTPITYGLMFGLVIVGYIMGTSLTRKYSSRFGLNKTILSESILVLGAATLMITIGLISHNNTWGIILPMILLMVGVGGIFPAYQAAIMQPLEEIAGTASGLFFFLQMISGALCGLVLGAVKINSPLPMLISIFVSCLFLVICFYMMIWKTEDREDTSAA